MGWRSAFEADHRFGALARIGYNAGMNVQAPFDRPATYQDVLDAPLHMVAEVVGGVLHTHPRPAPRHALAHTYLSGELSSPFGRGKGGPGGWWILIEPELHLGGDIIVPDIAGWRKERMPEMPDTAFFEIAPDWACEVHSPSTRRLDQHEKREIYRREGVSHLWFVDPDIRGLEAFELRGDAAQQEWVLIASLKDDDEVRVRPFDAVAFSLGALWA